MDYREETIGDDMPEKITTPGQGPLSEYWNEFCANILRSREDLPHLKVIKGAFHAGAVSIFHEFITPHDDKNKDGKFSEVDKARINMLSEEIRTFGEKEAEEVADCIQAYINGKK